MLKSKNIKSKIRVFTITIALMISQTISVFADNIPLETDELSIQTEPTMWLGDKYGKWKTVVNGSGEDAEIYVDEVQHSGCLAYHTIGYALFLGKENDNQDFKDGSIDNSIAPLFYFPTEGDDGNFKVDGKTYTSVKYINLEEVAEKFKSNGVKNPCTRRLFLSPIVTYRAYISKNAKADNDANYADLIMQIKRDDNDIYTLTRLFREHSDGTKNIEKLYRCHGTEFNAIAKKSKQCQSWEQLGRPKAAFYTDFANLSRFKKVKIDGEYVFAPYSECRISSLSSNNQGKKVQSFAPGKIIPVIEPEDTEQDEPSITGPLPILTYTSFPANSADGKSGDPVPDSAIGIDGEYYFGNKPKQKDYDWSEKGGGYIPVTKDITAYVKADNWIGQSQFAQCHDSAVYRVYFKIKYTEIKHKYKNGKQQTIKKTKTHKMYVDVPRDVYYWKLYSFSGYKLTNITLINGSYPDKTISFDFDPPMSENHLYYNGATSKYITNNVDWTGIGCADTVTIDVTGKSNRLNEGIAKAYATATNYAGFPTAWNDAFSITTDTKTLTYLTDDKVKMSRSNNRTEAPKHYTEWDQDYITDQDTVTIPPTVANGYYGTTIQRTYTKFAEFNAKEMDALTFYADTDTKSSNVSPSISTGSYAKTRQSVNPEHILNEFPEE